MTKRLNLKRVGVGLAVLAIVTVGTAALWPAPPRAVDEPPAAAHDVGESDDEGLTIPPEAMKQAGIVIEPLRLHSLADTIQAPGEVVSNRYGSGVVTPPTTGQITERRVAIGTKVRKGQVLAVMFSAEMAEAQGQFQIADQEWRRVRDLGKDIVSEKRFNEAAMQRQQAMTRLLGFGIAAREIEALAKRNGGVAGQVPLLSPQDGTVASDDFALGELVTPGKILFTVTDQRTAWVDARISPTQAQKLHEGQAAIARIGDESRPAVIRSIHPALDEVTRTVGVRLEVGNDDGRLRPGLFIDIDIPVAAATPVTAVPVDAVMRGPDGDWVVYTADESGRLRAVEVTVLRTAKTMTAIDGIAPGTPVVVTGAFFVQSEAAKGAFDVHNH
ncbi:efflux RND transporter periplasmic adaptor subunit [Magnetospirillum molischianum]|uniref:Uncharacterized protein n=1 Tax=Magnetospirillum molischianum DSM 120 TaxID=1150626 RepID=H8FPZ9_MAGML|nr:efflux RND transporter periplasmic adaptor subunit [Magnetospirillum molischianum]CCG40437.1 exported hypothetical protein [Magnetospirillum molischianum DSM 120]